MPYKNLRLAFSALTIILLFGCASVPNRRMIPVRESADDCLVLFPTKVENMTGTTIVRKYAYEFSGEYGSITLPDSTGFIAMIIHEPGVVLAKLKTFVPENMGFYGTKAEYAKNYPLPYEAGKIVVTPFMFVQEYKADGTGSYTSYVDFVKTDEETLRKTLDSAAAQANTATWQ